VAEEVTVDQVQVPVATDHPSQVKTRVVEHQPNQQSSRPNQLITQSQLAEAELAVKTQDRLTAQTALTQHFQPSRALEAVGG
jgi:hypothetical protein